MSTRDDILALLRRESLTIPEMLERLNVTRNAVIVPLRQLEAEGLIQGSERKDRKVGKPAVEYSAAPGQEDAGSQAYPSFAEHLMQALPDHMSRDQIRQLMRQIGKQMAAGLDTKGQSGFADRLKAGTDLLDAMGAGTVSGADGLRRRAAKLQLPAWARGAPRAVCLSRS